MPGTANVNMIALDSERKRNFPWERLDSRDRDACEFEEVDCIVVSIEHHSKADGESDGGDGEGEDTRVCTIAEGVGVAVEFEEELSPGRDGEAGEGAAVDSLPRHGAAGERRERDRDRDK